MIPLAAQQSDTSPTEYCRFCLMCRHVCPVTRVTANEATSPHGWALLVASARRGLVSWDADAVDRLYQCADCGLCRAHCVTDQPLPDALIAARAAVVAEGQAPAIVAELDERLRRGGNVYGEGGSVAPDGRAPAALLVGAEAWCRAPEEVRAARRLLDAAGIEYALAAVGRDDGYLPWTLGLHTTAQALARATLEELAAIGARRVIVLSPQQGHTLAYVYPRLGAPLPAGLDIVELTALLAGLVEAGRLVLRPLALEAVYHDPAQAPRLGGRGDAPRRLLQAAGVATREMLWRERRAMNAGASGGLPWTQPALAAQMARAVLDDAARAGAATLITDAPETLAHLRAHADGIGVRGLYTLLAESVGNRQ
jgi:Fe-S oxidoreductase